MSVSFLVKTLVESRVFGRSLAEKLGVGDVFWLKGDLGVGKTSLVRFMLEALVGEGGYFASPSFNIVHPYEGKKGRVYHVDLYRIEDEGEVQELGLEEAFDEGVCFVEWAEKAPSFMPKDRLLVEIFYGKGEEERRIELTGYGSFKERLVSWNNDLKKWNGF